MRGGRRGRVELLLRPIGPPRFPDERLSWLQSACRGPGGRVRERAGARARGRTGRDFRRVPEAGAVCSHANGKERWGAGVARLRHFWARNGKLLPPPAASPRRAVPPPLARAGRAPAPAPPSRPVRVWRGHWAPGLRRSAAGRRRR